MNKFELAADVAKAAMENPAIKHAVEEAAQVGAKMLEASAIRMPGYKFVAQVAEQSWGGSVFRKLAQEQDEQFAKAAANRITTGKATVPVMRAEGDRTVAVLHPVVSAALRGDKELLAVRKGDSEHSLALLAQEKLGLTPRTLRTARGGFGLVLSEGPDAQIAGANVTLSPFERGGFTPGYTHNFEAYGRLADRYGFNLEQIGRIRESGANGYSSDALRQIEQHLRLERGALRYEGNGLTMHDRDVRAFAGADEVPIERAAVRERPQVASNTTIKEKDVNGDTHYQYDIGGEKYHLYSTDQFWLSPYQWKGNGDKLARPDFKFHLIGENADAVRLMQDKLIPSLYKDPEWKNLLYGWKSVVPDFRDFSGRLSGQEAKTFTLYPGSENALARAAQKLGQTLDGLPLKSMSDQARIADRAAHPRLPVTLAQERYPMMTLSNGDKAVPFNDAINDAIRNDPRMGKISADTPFTPRRLRVLEELTGVEPGELVASNDGIVGVRVAGRIRQYGQNQIYLAEGSAVRGGTLIKPNLRHSGFDGRWALNAVGARYNIDPLQIKPVDVSKVW